MIELNNKNFNKNISEGLKLVVFTAKWCGYCQQQKAILRELDKIWVGEIDSDENHKLTTEYGISSFPTFILFKNGKPLTKFVGLHSKSELLNTLMRYI